MIGSKRGVRGSERQLHRSAVNVGNKVAGGIALMGAAVATLWVAARAQSGGFRFYGPLARVISPNGDQRNDVAFFCFENPSDSEVTGRVYTLLGTEVASMSPRALSAGGKDRGRPVVPHVQRDSRPREGHGTAPVGRPDVPAQFEESPLRRRVADLEHQPVRQGLQE